MTTFGTLVEITAVSRGHVFAIAAGLAMFAIAAALVKAAIGAWRAGVMVTQTEIIVRGPWGAESFPIDDAKRFVAMAIPAEKGNPTPGVVLELHDGSAAPIWALAKEGLVWNTERNVDAHRDTAEALNRILDTVQHDRLSTAGTR
jgi:hypothetical protein